LRVAGGGIDGAGLRARGFRFCPLWRGIKWELRLDWIFWKVVLVLVVTVMVFFEVGFFLGKIHTHFGLSVALVVIVVLVVWVV